MSNKSRIPSAEELASLRLHDAKHLAKRAGVNRCTAHRAKAGEGVHPLLLRALLEAASELSSETVAA